MLLWEHQSLSYGFIWSHGRLMTITTGCKTEQVCNKEDIAWKETLNNGYAVN